MQLLPTRHAPMNVFFTHNNCFCVLCPLKEIPNISWTAQLYLRHASTHLIGQPWKCFCTMCLMSLSVYLIFISLAESANGREPVDFSVNANAIIISEILAMKWTRRTCCESATPPQSNTDGMVRVFLGDRLIAHHEEMSINQATCALWVI